MARLFFEGIAESPGEGLFGQRLLGLGLIDAHAREAEAKPAPAKGEAKPAPDKADAA